MKQTWIASLLIPVVSLWGCGRADSSLSTISFVAEESTALRTIPCQEPGPGPLLPTALQEGTLLTQGQAIGSFNIVSGPTLRLDANGCPTWVIGSELTVNTANRERVFFAPELVVPLDGRTIFQAEAGPDCRNPVGVFTFIGSESGFWQFTEWRCNLQRDITRQSGLYTSATALP